MPQLTKLVLAASLGPPLLDRLRAAYPDLEVVVAADRADLAEALEGAQALVGGGLTDALLERAPQLGWYHVGGAGVEDTLTPDLIASDVIVTNNSGVSAPNMAEHLLGLMLAFARDFPALMRAQERHEWLREVRVFELGGQTLGVVGLGEIGQELAWRAAALEMRVVGLRRHPGAPPPGVDHVYGPDALDDLLAASDHVAVTLPLTARTRGLIGAPELAAMKPSAYIYNVGRGPIIDQEALIAALRDSWIAGAGLDVTDPEPLPADSPLWDLPNVILTDHTSGRTARRWERGLPIVLENIGRYRRGEPLRNVVDKREGY